MSRSVINIETAIAYIEDHLSDKLDLQIVADAVHYSKYHLHRTFAEVTGLTLHDYIQRRQLTEAAKLLVFGRKPIVEIALMCGYGSQQAFTAAFKAMYKTPPAKYRESGSFYPLQLRFSLHTDSMCDQFAQKDIVPADINDIPAWMELMRLSIDGYPVMDENQSLSEITHRIKTGQALVLKSKGLLIAAMAYTASTGSIDFLGVHPQYRRQGIQKLFLDALLQIYLPGRAISMTTYREHDKADTGHRQILKSLGFAERELLVEFGYPTQRFVLSAKEEDNKNDETNLQP